MYTFNPFTKKPDFYQTTYISGSRTFTGLTDTPSSYNDNSLIISSASSIDYVPKNVLTISESNVSIGDADVSPVYKVYIRDGLTSLGADSPRTFFSYGTFSGSVNYSLVNYIANRVYLDLDNIDVSGMSTQPYGVKYGPWFYGNYTSINTVEQLDFDTYHAEVIGGKVDVYYGGISANTSVYGQIIEAGTKSGGTTEISYLTGLNVGTYNYNDLSTLGSMFGIDIDTRSYAGNGSVGSIHGVMNQTVDHGLGTGNGALMGELLWAGLYTQVDDVFAQADKIHAMQVQAMCGYDTSYTPSGVTTTDLYGIEVSIGTVGVNTSVTNGYTLYVAGSPQIVGDNSGTTENLYGLYIEDITAGSNKNYSIYSEGGENYFGGNITTSGSLAITTTSGYEYSSDDYANVYIADVSKNYFTSNYSNDTGLAIDKDIQARGDGTNPRIYGADINVATQRNDGIDNTYLIGISSFADHDGNSLADLVCGLQITSSCNGEGDASEVIGVSVLSRSDGQDYDNGPGFVASPGTADKVYGVKITTGSQYQGKVNDMYGIMVASPDNSGFPGTIDNSYGLYIGDHSSGTTTATGVSYSIYSEGGQNYFGGNITTSGVFNMPSNPPATAGAAGTRGDIAWDDSYFYVCTADNTWKRASLSSW